MVSQNKVFLLDGEFGRMFWKYEYLLFGDLGFCLCCEVVNWGVVVFKNMVYMVILDIYFVVFDNIIGCVVWDVKLGDY